MIDDETLDHLLTRSAPQPAHPADCLVCRAETQPVRRTARRRGMTASVVGAGVLVGVAGTAAALGGLPFVGDGQASGTRTLGGAACEFTFEIVPQGVPADAPNVVAAKAILAQIDIATIDITDEVADARTWVADDLVERTAVYTAVTQTVNDGLDDRGLAHQGVTVVETDQCDTVP